MGDDIDAEIKAQQQSRGTGFGEMQEDDGVYDGGGPGGDLTRGAARIIISGPAGLQAAWKDVVTKAVPLQTGGIAGGGIPGGVVVGASDGGLVSAEVMITTVSTTLIVMFT